MAGALSGCASGGDAGPVASSVSATAGDASASNDAASFADVAASFDASALDIDYSNRDQDASYDDASATRITLAGGSVVVDGAGATADGSTATITAEGVYVVSGSLDDGQLVVEAADEAKVQVVLAGATIHNEDGPAVYVKQADKCFVTLADGTRNALSDGAGYVLEDGSDEPCATLFSRADLTLNGSGALTVVGAYRHAVCSKDDLVVTGGAYTVSAMEDALRGRDCVKIANGDFVLTAGGDGIKSNKDTNAVKGFVSIDGGSFAIEAGDDGIQAQTYLRIAGGNLSIAASDDALHSGLEGLLAGGELDLEAGDDAFHAETKLVVDGGVANVSACCEGYEAEKLYINGGDTHIVASDDAINATSADLSGDEEGATAPAAGAALAPGGRQGAGQAPSERGMGDGSFAGGGAGGMGLGDESCLIQINGGYTVLDSAGDAVDSNGSVEITGGVLLVNGPTSGGDGSFDYDLTATVTGGTVLMVGSAGMAQSFTSGEQPFAFVAVGGNAGDGVAVVDAGGTVVASLTAAKQFGMVLASCPAFVEGGACSVVVGGIASGANADGYTDSGTVSGGVSTEVATSTVAAGGEARPAKQPVA